jgi:hypothetical protein
MNTVSSDITNDPREILFAVCLTGSTAIFDAYTTYMQEFMKRSAEPTDFQKRRLWRRGANARLLGFDLL